MRRNKTKVANGRAIPKKGIDIPIAPKDEQVEALMPYVPMTQKQSVAKRKVGGEMKSEFPKARMEGKEKVRGRSSPTLCQAGGTTVHVPSYSQAPDEFLNDSPQNSTTSAGRGTVGTHPQMAGTSAGTVSNACAWPRTSKTRKERCLNDKSYRPNKGDFKNMPPRVF